MTMIGERRHSECGNVYELDGVATDQVYVRRVSNGTGGPLWDDAVVYCWPRSAWDSLEVATR